MAHRVGVKKAALTYLAQHSRSPITLSELARKLRIGSEAEYRELRAVIRDLVKSGTLEEDARSRIRYLGTQRRSRTEMPRRITGTLSVLRRGGGIVRAESGGEEIFVPQGFLKTALHGDTVKVVRLAARPGRAPAGGSELPQGEVVEIVRRATATVTGTLEVGRQFAFVVPDDERIRRDIYVPRDQAQKASPGDKVVVQLLPWEDEHLNPEGKILEVLGPAGDARVEVMAVARSFSLPLSFPADVELEAAQLSGRIAASELAGRLDLLGTTCFTIDPEDAKDFDDALSLVGRPGLRWQLGVHIADVSHYVKEGSALDREARSSGTSVYMVNEVIPMLPERLSNDLCSLRPAEDRLTYSVLMDLNAHGTVESYRFVKSVIHSVRRFTYEEVQQIITAGTGELSEVILPLHKLTRVLTQKRHRNGSLDFDTEEAAFRFDARGFPTHIVKKARLDAHRLVEECMLLANRLVAEHVGRADGKPFLYRVHDLPDPKRLAELAQFVRQFGFSLDVKSGVPSRELQKLLSKAEGSEVENLINEVALRSMAKAVYGTKNIGHYGLAFRSYTHFTSPIRRYQDLVVHRLLEEYSRRVEPSQLAHLHDVLPGVAEHCSERERTAVAAERASVKVMQVEYMKRHLGDVFEGIIAGVTAFGLFVELNDLLVEGLVHVRDLEDDYYVFDEQHYALKGRSTLRQYRLGDRVRVRVAAVKPEEGEIDLVMAEEPVPEQIRPKGRFRKRG